MLKLGMASSLITQPSIPNEESHGPETHGEMAKICKYCAHRPPLKTSDLPAGRESDNVYDLLNNRSQETMRKDLETALIILVQAESKTADLDASLIERIYWGLMTVEKRLSCDRNLDMNKRVERIEKAQVYIAKVETIVLRTSNNSLRAQASLEQNILKGREARLKTNMGIDVDESKRVMADALQGMDNELEKLKKIDRLSFDEVYPAAATWRDQRADPTV